MGSAAPSASLASAEQHFASASGAWIDPAGGDWALWRGAITGSLVVSALAAKGGDWSR